MGVRECEGSLDGGVGGAVVDEKDLPATGGSRVGLLGELAVDLGLAARSTADRGPVLFCGRICSLGEDAVFVSEVVDRFFEHADKAVLFVEGGYDDRHEELGWVNWDAFQGEVPIFLFLPSSFVYLVQPAG